MFIGCHEDVLAVRTVGGEDLTLPRRTRADQVRDVSLRACI